MPHGELLIGTATSLSNIAIHALTMAILNWTAHRAARATEASGARVRLVVVMMAAVTILMAAHIAEIGVWTLVYLMLGAVPQAGEAFYFAFVNYTTLGYGDVLPDAYWRLIGPMTALTGVLMVGWSTAVMYDVLRSIAQIIPMRTGHSAEVRKPPAQ